jgi:hypothetical protein
MGRACFAWRHAPPGAIGGGKEGERFGEQRSDVARPAAVCGEDTGRSAALAAKSRSSQAEREISGAIGADVAGGRARGAQRRTGGRSPRELV